MNRPEPEPEPEIDWAELLDELNAAEAELLDEDPDLNDCRDWEFVP